MSEDRLRTAGPHLGLKGIGDIEEGVVFRRRTVDERGPRWLAGRSRRIRTPGRPRRAASSRASTTRSMITAAVSELDLWNVGDAIRHRSTTLGGRSGVCVVYISSTQGAWSRRLQHVGLEITAHRSHSPLRYESVKVGNLNEHFLNLDG
jgi:hypothetical protein